MIAIEELVDIHAEIFSEASQRFILEEVIKKSRMSYSNKDLYTVFTMPKKSGKVRKITAPLPELKAVQYDLLYNLLYRRRAHPCAVGFIKNIGVIEGAKRHLGAKALFTIDVKDFFPSITGIKVASTLVYSLITWVESEINSSVNSEIREGIISYVKRVLMPLVMYDGGLPQGAPTSPAISNLVCKSLDKSLKRFADSKDFKYTRYADDITFSTTNSKIDLRPIVDTVERILVSNGLRVNKKKTRLQRRHRRMSVTGVVINDKPSVPRWKWKNFRAKLHNLEKSGKCLTREEYERTLGYAQWLYQLDPKKASPYIKQLSRINHE